ncbi:hypothetical protein R3P38DRAFT_2778450 [Favolaschia claudopus]|uniref:Uncharacterized protein n=1 Tax=Favolaschia claudopus TaxID=2862362 RepID=A0AAW0BGY3_9AGAR
MSDLASFRADLLAGPYYLGNEDVISSLAWKKVGRDEMVVSAEEAAKHASNMEKQSNTDHDNEGSEGGEGVGADDLNPVGLTVVAMVSPENCYLTPCANWNGPTEFDPSFADIKLNCRLVAPLNSLFAGDFQFAMRTITKLMAQVETDGYKKSGIFNFNENPKIGFKIRHIVFEPKEEDDDGDDELKRGDKQKKKADDPSIIELFVLQDWPVKNAAVKEALEGMENSHVVIPIRAYDVDGDLISPAHYMSKLSGAVVRATLTLSHWKIGRDKRDTYTADIESLRVLVPASVAGSSSPRKRRVAPIAKKDPGSDYAEKTSGKRSTRCRRSKALA